MKIIKISGNDCGGFQAPKGHLDTQLFPECKGKETDRDIVKKTEKRRKSKKAENVNNNIVSEAKKKKKYNAWAICHSNVDKKEDPEKFERCVMDVKKKQASNSFNLKEYKTSSNNTKCNKC